MVSPTGPQILSFFQSLEPQMIQWLVELTNRDTPSTSKPSLDALSKELAGRFSGFGARVEILPASDAGNHLIARFGPDPRGKKQLLLLGHLDTVWDLGEAGRRPARIEGGKLYGPGALDMRGGLTLLLALGNFLSFNVGHLKGPVTMLLVSDEETGSHSARPYIESEGRRSNAALVLEPCLPGGALKTSRKGVGVFRITARGVAAHAGVNFERGANAIEEISRQIQELYRLVDPSRGITVNVGTICGGTRSNVVADFAEIEVDVRVPSVTDGMRLSRQIFELLPTNPSVRLEIQGGINRPPLERSDLIVNLFKQARVLAADLGIDLQEGSTGGGSDGSFTAAMGVPTLDGLGPDGDGPHALHEHVLLSSLVPRAALLTHLVLRL